MCICGVMDHGSTLTLLSEITLCPCYEALDLPYLCAASHTQVVDYCTWQVRYVTNLDLPLNMSVTLHYIPCPSLRECASLKPFHQRNLGRCRHGILRLPTCARICTKTVQALEVAAIITDIIIWNIHGDVKRGWRHCRVQRRIDTAC